jgi:hypothetical protein
VANNVNITNRGFEYICQWMAGNYGSGAGKYTLPSFIGWGNACGSNATTAVLPGAQPTTTQGTGQWSDVGPFREFTTEARVAASSTAVTNNTIGQGTVTTQFVGTITAGANHNTQSSNAEGGSVGESFLAFTATKPYETTLFTAITSGATAFTVSTAWPAVSTPFYVQVNNEVITVSATATTTTATSITRGVNGSSANAGAAGDGVSLGNIPGAGANNPNSADMFAHAGFTSLALNSGDSIQFTWQINVTS